MKFANDFIVIHLAAFDRYVAAVVDIERLSSEHSNAQFSHYKLMHSQQQQQQ